MTTRAKVDEATLSLLGARPAPQPVPSAILAVDGADIVASCVRFGFRRAFVEVAVGQRVLHICTGCAVPTEYPGSDPLRAREATERQHAGHVAEGEGDLAMACARRGPRRALVEAVVGDVVWSACLVCRVVERARAYSLAEIREQVIARHASCIAKVGQGAR